MEIKKTSWHFWFYKLLYRPYYPPATSNLCKYFWMTVFGMAVTAVFCVLCSIILAGIVALFYAFTIYSFFGLAVLLLVIALFVIRSRRPDAPKAEPGLVRLYLKAKKDKVCPLVEFVN